MTAGQVNLQADFKVMDGIIQEVKHNIKRLEELSGGMQCMERNCERILASLKILELNVSDVLEFME